VPFSPLTAICTSRQPVLIRIAQTPIPVNALWLLPAGGGEARVVHSRAGGISSVMAAKDADATFINAEVLAGFADEENDEERRKARKDNKVSAILHSGYPVRYWDADLGPAEPRLFAVEQGEETEPGKPSHSGRRCAA
jgi:hypothetical protein